MSIIKQYQQQIETLNAAIKNAREAAEKDAADLAQAQEDIGQLLDDMKTAFEAIIHTTQLFGLNILDGSLSGVSPLKLIQKVAPKVMKGGLNFDKLDAALPILKKYEHLIEK